MRGGIYILLISGLLISLPSASQENKKTINDRSAGTVNLLSASPNASAETNRTITSGGGVYEVPLGEKSSLYLNDEFIPGTIVLSDQRKMEGVPLRYDVYHQQMQFIMEDDTLGIARPEEVASLSFDGRNFIYYPYEYQRVIDTGLFELLIDGSCKLLMRHKVDYHFSGSGNQKDEYIKSTCLYVSRRGRPALEMNASKRAVCSFLEDNEEEVRDFIKTNRLKMNHYEDVMMVVEFYNSMKGDRRY